MFESADLMDQASRRTGLVDFGLAPLMDGLSRLCHALELEARLTESGAAAATDEIIGILAERLKVEDWYRQAPEIEQQKIRAPLWVVGLPRSGTTALSQYLATDPANRSIRRWEASHPTPPPDVANEVNDPRIRETQAMLDRRYAASPELRSMNPIAAHDPSENECFLRHTFQSLSFAGVYDVPSYLEWALQCDMSSAYCYFLRVLRLLQWRRPPERWNLKFPLDLFYLKTIADNLPDVRFIWIHRDPVMTVPSAASLLAARRRPHTRSIDKFALGRSELALRVEQVERGMRYRDQAGALPLVNLYNTDLIRSPFGTVRDLYGQLNLDFSPDFAAALRQRIAERPKGRFGNHHYSAEEFGLSNVQLRSAFAEYTSRYRLSLDC